MSLLLIGSSHA